MSKPLAWINAITGDVTTVDCSDTILWAPLYLAPKNQESLSTKQAEDLWETTFKSAVPYYIFDEICVAIEQYHGIGVDDE